MKIHDELVLDIRERYDRLNSYRLVAQELDDVVSFTMIRHIVIDGAWSPKVARQIGLMRRRVRLAADLDRIEQREALKRMASNQGKTWSEYCQWMADIMEKV